MKLTLAEVKHIANLARLQLTQEEMEQYPLQLSAILNYAACLQELDTSDIPPTSSVLHANGYLREDIPAASLDSAELLANAPLVKHKQFRVPPVLE